MGISSARRALAVALLLLIGALAGAGCKKSPSEVRSPQAKPTPSAAARTSHVETQMRHVHLRIMEGVTLQIRNLRGRLVRKAPEGPVIFDDRDSFVLEIDSGEIAIATPDLARLMNGYVFAYPDSPLKKMSFAIVGNELRQEGLVHKGVEIPFTVVGSVSVTPENWIRVHPSKIEAVGIPVKGLLEFFGLELEKLLKLKGVASVKIEGDDFLLDPERLLPPPQIKGRVTAVRLEKDKLVQIFGAPNPESALQPPISGANYLFFRGGLLRFGKLTMSDADLEIVDADLRDPFDFFQEKYNEQLVAGYSKNTPDGGLIVFMPDYDQVAAKPKPSLRPRIPSRTARRT
ncbi:MAG TPA: hypothetical protein VIA29_01820 [Thermoanaerobaculia bacterium]